MRLTDWSHTLRWRLIWPVVALNLLAVAATIWLANRTLQESLYKNARVRAQIISNAVNYAAESASNPADLRRFLYSVGAEEDVDLIIVAVNHSPHVVACTRHEWTGAKLDQLPWPDAAEALRNAISSGRTDECLLPANGELQMTLPIFLPDGENYGLALQPGAVLVRIDQTADRAEVTRTIFMGALWFILQLLVINALILLLIQRRVLRPLQLIGATLSRRRSGDTSARAPVVAQDEIGAVAGAMNKVFDRREELETEAHTRAVELTKTNQRLQESEERFRIAAESSTDVIYDWSLLTGAVVWHHDIGAALGYKPDEFTPTHEAWAQAIHPEDRGRILAALDQHLLKGVPFDMEYRMVAKDGSFIYWRDRGNTLRDSQNKPIRMIGVMNDVTADRLAAQQLRAAKEAAETANRTKDEFLAALSHELRTPLNPVLMLAGELERSPNVPPDLREGFGLIRHNVELEARLIDDLLDLTRVTRGKFHLELQALDLYSVIHKAIDTVLITIQARGLALHVDLTAPDHWVMGDPVRLQQVFWNVLKNAAKFTSPGGRIFIRSERRDGGTIRISIMDTGMGLARENIERIFDAFEQVQHPGGHQFGGLGLGLAISRRLVEAHGGRIWAESAGPNRGTTFHIELPLSAAPTEQGPAKKAAPSRPTPLTPLSILLVEDHDETRMIMERLLKRRGHEVFSAGNVEAAKGFAAEREFDLVISDIGLPDGNGYELMTELRRTHPSLLGIALSGFGMEKDIQRSRDVGFFAHLTKPVDMKVLERTIEEARQQVGED